MSVALPVIRRGFHILLLTALAAALLTATRAEPTIDLSTPGAIQNVAFNGSADIFLETLDPVIEGDAKTKGHEKDIEIDAVSVGFSRSVTAHEPGPANFSEFSLSKRLDAASVKLAEHVMTGDPFDEARIVFEVPATSSSKARIILTYELQNVFITSHQMSGSGGLSESLSLNYGEIRMTYHPYKADGTALPTITTCWNIVEDIPCAI